MTEAAPTRAPARRGRLRYLRFLPVLAIGMVAVALLVAGWDQHLSLATFLAKREAFASLVALHRASAVVLFVLSYCLAVALSMPGTSLFTVAGGFLFGGLVGGGSAAFAATIGAIAIFLVARTSLGIALRARLGPKLQYFAQCLQANAAPVLLFLRLAPVFPFWLVNLATALLDVRLSTFVWTTFVGILPASFAFAFAGAGLDSLVAAQQRAYEACVASRQQPCTMDLSMANLMTSQMLLAFAALACLALIPLAVKLVRLAAARSSR